jgi:DNA-binding CsgD family transcriptional regulator
VTVWDTGLAARVQLEALAAGRLSPDIARPELFKLGDARPSAPAAKVVDRPRRDRPAERLEQQIKPPDDQPTLTLTAREREVLTWISLGKFAWEIGEILGIAKRTVDEHTQAAARKLGASNRTQAVAIAIRDCLIDL